MTSKCSNKKKKNNNRDFQASTLTRRRRRRRECLAASGRWRFRHFWSASLKSCAFLTSNKEIGWFLVYLITGVGDAALKLDGGRQVAGRAEEKLVSRVPFCSRVQQPTSRGAALWRVPALLNLRQGAQVQTETNLGVLNNKRKTSFFPKYVWIWMNSNPQSKTFWLNTLQSH